MKWRECREWAGLGIEIFTLGAVIWYASIASNQWHGTIRANHLTEQALEETKGLAKTAAEQAIAAKTSAEAEAATTRAWIAVQGFPPWKAVDQQTLHIEANFKNAGKTPAIDANAGFEFRYSADHVMPKFRGCPKFTDHYGTMSADQQIQLRRDHRLHPEELKAIVDHRASIYVHGCFQYRDVLKSKEPRLTEFCVEYGLRDGVAPCTSLNRME